MSYKLDSRTLASDDSVLDVTDLTCLLMACIVPPSAEAWSQGLTSKEWGLKMTNMHVMYSKWCYITRPPLHFLHLPGPGSEPSPVSGQRLSPCKTGQEAYRAIPTFHQSLLAVIYIDKALPFSPYSAPYIFTALTDATIWFLQDRGLGIALITRITLCFRASPLFPFRLTSVH